MDNSFSVKMRGRATGSARRLLFILGDQLNPGSALLEQIDRSDDVILMAEVREEAEHVPSHRQRTTLFLSAMRHFALHLVDKGFRVRYVALDDPDNTHSLHGELQRALDALAPDRVRMMLPGEHRVDESVRRTTAESGVALDIIEDDSFSCSLQAFDEWAREKRNLVMEYFYRERRRCLDILMSNGKPVGGAWNFDRDNRERFDRTPAVPSPYRPRADDITLEVMKLVEGSFPDAYGRMDQFHWPVNRSQALRALRKFIDDRLPNFGTYEDAMWSGEPFLYHSLLSPALNLKLISPRECVDAAVEAFHSGKAGINNVEGFVRQVIGWREFMRGIYYREGNGYADRNELDHECRLPGFFWNGETDMNCMHHCLGEVIDNAYGHHIARLMVIGNFALLAGVQPRGIHEWFLGMYVDGVEWVTAPNVVGMSQYADGGVVATKPYAGSGKYIKRMSNYCEGCRYDVSKRTGPDACPFNTFYWDFLIRHRKRLGGNQRMALVMKNVDRMARSEILAVRKDAGKLRDRMGIS